MPAPSLRDLRESRGLSQSALGIHQVMVSRYENGHEYPSPASITKIATALAAVAPVTVPEVVAACRESQRRALVARGRAARVVGHGRLSCAHRSRTTGRKVGVK